ncbi:MAG: hypothetical protein AVDCRST_MAG06-374, partial [uncultured Nocardioides sp.]
DRTDAPAPVLREAEAHADGEPVRGIRPRPRGRPADGVRGAEAVRVQGAGDLLHRLHAHAPGVRLQGPGRARPRLGLRRHRRDGRPDRVLPQGVRRQPAALDVPHRGTWIRRHRPGAQHGGRPAAPLHRARLPARPLRLRERRRRPAALGQPPDEHRGPLHRRRARRAGRLPGRRRRGGGHGRADGSL